MPPSGSIVYLDSSAIVKLVVQEPETEAVRTFLRRFPHRISSILARVEVTRAARAYGASAGRQADAVLRTISTVDVTHELAEVAGRLDPLNLRSLDAVHFATALSIGPALGALVTYDARTASAAHDVGLPVTSPT